MSPTQINPFFNHPTIPLGLNDTPAVGISKFVFESLVPLNNIDKFLDLLRKNKENMAARNIGENFGVLMPIYRKKSCRLHGCKWDLTFYLSV
jgi:hypothetical protein